MTIFDIICDYIVRILQRRGDIVEFAYFVVAVLYFVVYYSSSDITCEVLESNFTTNS